MTKGNLDGLRLFLSLSLLAGFIGSIAAGKGHAFDGSRISPVLDEKLTTDQSQSLWRILSQIDPGVAGYNKRGYADVGDEMAQWDDTKTDGGYKRNELFQLRFG